MEEGIFKKGVWWGGRLKSPCCRYSPVREEGEQAKLLSTEFKNKYLSATNWLNTMFGLALRMRAQSCKLASWVWRRSHLLIKNLYMLLLVAARQYQDSSQLFKNKQPNTNHLRKIIKAKNKTNGRKQTKEQLETSQQNNKAVHCHQPTLR